ncbi:MAG: AAA family ATPase [Desulfurococcaceae archaeon]|nr:AAA family ATPase [Desulfurococcaceae archaeon]
MVVIAVSGPPGGGKTTQALKLAEKLKLEYHSAGSIFRAIASERGVSLEELSVQAMKAPEIDLEIDKRSIELSKENAVLDGHLTAWVLKDIADVKVLITAPLLTRAMRISMRDGKKLEDSLRETIIREYSQLRRFIEYYGIDPRDTEVFDLTISTGKLIPEDTESIVSVAVEKLLKAAGRK